VVKQVKKWSTTWCRAFNKLRISEFRFLTDLHLYVWTVVKRGVTVLLQLCGAIHSPQSTLWKTRRYLTNSVVSSNKAVISVADLLSFLTHTEVTIVDSEGTIKQYEWWGKWDINFCSTNLHTFSVPHWKAFPVVLKRGFQVMMLWKCKAGLVKCKLCVYTTSCTEISVFSYHLLHFLL